MRGLPDLCREVLEQGLSDSRQIESAEDGEGDGGECRTWLVRLGRGVLPRGGLARCVAVYSSRTNM